jgi:hypothetical protein
MRDGALTLSVFSQDRCFLPEGVGAGPLPGTPCTDRIPVHLALDAIILVEAAAPRTAPVVRGITIVGGNAPRLRAVKVTASA